MHGVETELLTGTEVMGTGAREGWEWLARLQTLERCTFAAQSKAPFRVPPSPLAAADTDGIVQACLQSGGWRLVSGAPHMVW